MTTNCAPTRRQLAPTAAAAAARALDFVVVYTVIVYQPSTATTAQLETLSISFSSVSVLSPTQLATLLNSTLTALVSVGGTPVVGTLTAEVNGQTCSGTACGDLIYRFGQTNNVSVNVGAIVGGVVGGFAALVIFVAAVVIARRRSGRNDRDFGRTDASSKETHYL